MLLCDYEGVVKVIEIGDGVMDMVIKNGTIIMGNGNIMTVIRRGDVVYHHVFTGMPGSGRFIPRHVTI